MGCYKCIGQGIGYVKPMDFGPDYCSKCGTKLKNVCSACNGTGKNMFATQYCSNCGSKIDTTCSSCGGSGKISSFHTCF